MLRLPRLWLPRLDATERQLRAAEDARRTQEAIARAMAVLALIEEVLTQRLRS